MEFFRRNYKFCKNKNKKMKLQNEKEFKSSYTESDTELSNNNFAITKYIPMELDQKIIKIITRMWITRRKAQNNFRFFNFLHHFFKRMV